MGEVVPFPSSRSRRTRDVRGEVVPFPSSRSRRTRGQGRQGNAPRGALVKNLFCCFSRALWWPVEEDRQFTTDTTPPFDRDAN